MNKRMRTRGFTLIELLVVISIIGLLAGTATVGVGPVMARVREFRREQDMRNLYRIFMLYEQAYGRYPTSSRDRTRSTGVRDLYLLYAGGYLGRDDLELLQPPGANLMQFSREPTIDEFTKDYIGYSYNSTAFGGGATPEPILADQGVSTGVLQLDTQDPGLAPYARNRALVLFTDGRVRRIGADARGRLSTADVSPEQWARLVD